MTDYLQIATKYTPPNVTVKYRKSLSGVARFATTTLEAPEPKTRASLYIYLHECAHFHLEHWNRKKPRYVQEYEAEQWATKTMRAEGIPVPKKMLDRAKAYVTRKVIQAQDRGLKNLNPNIRRYISRKDK